MATPTYIPLATTTLASSASSVTFSSIDQSYGDLMLVFDGEFTSQGLVYASLNNDTNTANYPAVRMNSDNNGKSSSVSNAQGIPVVYSGFSLNENLAVVQIMDYSATDKHKTALTRTNNPAQPLVEALVCRWADTSAVTEIDVFPTAGNLASGTTISLYGVAK